MQRIWCTILCYFSFFTVLVHSGLSGSNQCNTAFGLEGGIEDGQLSALSYYESFSNGNGEVFQAHPRCARKDHHYCAWCAESAKGQYLEVDLRSDVLITGIATQGYETLSGAYFVTKYRVAFRRDRKTWKVLPEVMSGNHDGRSVVRHNFSSPMYARYIRVYPVAYRNTICMRMELYGCSNPSSALTTPPASTTQSAANETPPVNLPPGTRTTASTSTGKLMINQSTPAPSALRTTPSSTTLRVANDETHENVSTTTRATSASSTEKPMISHSTTDQPVGSDTTIIEIVVPIAVVGTICSVLWYCHRKRKRNERKSKEGVVGLSAFPRQQPHGSSPEITETTERDWIEDDSDLEVTTNEIVMSNANP